MLRKLFNKGRDLLGVRCFEWEYVEEGDDAKGRATLQGIRATLVEISLYSKIYDIALFPRFHVECRILLEFSHDFIVIPSATPLMNLVNTAAIF
jgi:hypothetical protein